MEEMMREIKLSKAETLKILEKKWRLYGNDYQSHCDKNDHLFIRDMKRFELPRHATLANKLKETTQWRFTFDNCLILQFFLNKFRMPFEIGRTYEEDGVKIQIQILDGDGENASFYHGSGTHQRYITKQTHYFTHDHWHFSSHTIIKQCLVESVVADVLNTDICDIHQTAVHVDDDHVAYNTTTFDIDQLHGITVKLVHMNDKEFLLSRDTRIEKKKVVKVEKIAPPTPKRKIYTEGIVMTQCTLPFSVQKKQKMSTTQIDI
jgi:hypothetical protein